MRVPRSNRTFVKSVQSVAERFPLKFTFSHALKSSRYDSAFIFFPVSESQLQFKETLTAVESHPSMMRIAS